MMCSLKLLVTNQPKTPLILPADMSLSTATASSSLHCAVRLQVDSLLNQDPEYVMSGKQYISAVQQDEQRRETKFNQTLCKLTFQFTIQSLKDKTTAYIAAGMEKTSKCPVSNENDKMGNVHTTLTLWYIHVMFISPQLALQPKQVHLNLSAPTMRSEYCSVFKVIHCHCNFSTIKSKAHSARTHLFTAQKQLHVLPTEYSQHLAVYKNKMEILTVVWSEISKPYRYCYLKIHNMGGNKKCLDYV